MVDEPVFVKADGPIPMNLGLIAIRSEDGTVKPGLPGVKDALSRLQPGTAQGWLFWARGDEWIAAAPPTDDGEYVVRVGLAKPEPDGNEFVVHDVMSAVCVAELTGVDALQVVREAESRGLST
jgi:hypothetical protein